MLRFVFILCVAFFPHLLLASDSCLADFEVIVDGDNTVIKYTPILEFFGRRYDTSVSPEQWGGGFFTNLSKPIEDGVLWEGDWPWAHIPILMDERMAAIPDRQGQAVWLWMTPDGPYSIGHFHRGLIQAIATQRPGEVDESQKRLTDQERVVANMLSVEGHRFRSEREGDGRNAEGTLSVPTKTGQVNVPVEYKTLEEASDTALKRALEKSLKKNGQSPFIVVDARDVNLDYMASNMGVVRLLGHIRSQWDRKDKRNVREIRVLGNEFDSTYMIFFSDETDLNWH